jgi:hypothetical protein
MKNIVKLTLIFCFGIFMSSCLEDTPITDYSEDAIKPIVLIPNGNFPSVQKANPIALDYKTEGQDLKVYARVSYVRPLSTDVVVNIAKDASIITEYNAKNGTTYQELPSNAYQLPSSLSITIPAGQQEAFAVVKVFADKVDLAKSNMIAFKIVDAGSQPVASNFQKIVFPIVVKNSYEANYNVTGYFFHPSSPRGVNAAKYMSTVSASVVQGQVGDLGGWNFQVSVGANGVISGWNPVDATLANAPVPSSGLLTTDNPAGISTYPGPGGFVHTTYNNTYDAAKKTFLLHYGYGGGSSGPSGWTRQIYEKWVRQ